MAIVNMSKFELLAFKSDKEAIVSEIQKLEYAHYADLNKKTDEEIEAKASTDKERVSEISTRLSRIVWCIDQLSQYEGSKKVIPVLSEEEMKDIAASIDFDKVYEEIYSLYSEKEKIKQEITEVHTKSMDLMPWKRLNISLKDIGENAMTVKMLGTVHADYDQAFKAMIEENDLVYADLVSERAGIKYYLCVALAKDRQEAVELLRKNGFNQVKLAFSEEPAAELKSLEAAEVKLNEALSENAKVFAGNLEYLVKLKALYEVEASEKVKHSSIENFKETNSIQLISGYIPTSKEADFKRSIEETAKSHCDLSIKPADRDDENVPIVLKNNKFVSAFESLTKMYSLPKYNELDPTPALAPFYWFFFGMMVADIGYGAVLFLGTLFGIKRSNPKPPKDSLLRMINLCSIAVIFWGVMYGSLFGVTLKMNGRPIAIFNTEKDFMLLLGVSIALGLVHLFSGLGVKAYMLIRDGKPVDAFLDVGLWVFALVGLIGLIGGNMIDMGSAAMMVFKVLMIASMVGILVFGARDRESIGARIGGGIYELYGITGYIGDFVSYSRLMALGLAGAFIAYAVNLIAKLVGHGPGLIASVIILVVFHGFNIFLSSLSGYVHSARLTYVEFFGKFYEGGGIAFKNQKAVPKYVRLK